MKRCAFLMSSCDTYEDLWNPFFECLDIYWREMSCPVYLNTEYKKFVPKKELHFSVTTLNQTSSKTISWSRRFIDVLNRIEEEYVFLVLDDYFACNEVNTSLFKEILDIMDNDESIASFQMCGTRIRNNHTDSYQESKRMEYRLIKKSGWKTHFVPTVWRKSKLLEWLRPWESIWAFEECGSKRARRWNYEEKVYIVENPPIYDYLWIRDCSAVVNGKWIAEKELIDFFEKNNVSVDWSKRGKMTYDEYQAISMKDVIKRYSFKEIVLKSVNRVRSFF